MTEAINYATSGEKLRILRRDSNLSMVDVAAKAGISRTYLWQIETSDHVPSFDIAKKLAAIFNSKPEEIWDDFRYTQETTSAPIDSGDNQEHQSRLNFDDLIWTLITARASINLRKARYAETMSPLLDWGISSGIIEQFTELAKKWQQNEVTKLLISAVDAEDKDDFKEAINAYKKAKELVRDSNLNALIDFSLGNLYREACEYSDAIHHLSQAFSGLQNRIKPEDLASLETALGWLYYRAGNYSNAGKHFSQAIIRWDEIPQKEPLKYEESALSAYRGLASLRERQGDYATALVHFEEIKKRAEKDGDLYERAWITSRLSFLRIHNGEWDEAETDMDKGLSYCDTLIKFSKNPRTVKILQEIILNNKALLRVRKGKYAEAVEFSNLALKQALDLSDKRGEAFCHMFLSLAYIAVEDWENALKHAQLAELRFEEMKILYYIPEVLSLQAEIFLVKIGGNAAYPVVLEALSRSTAVESKSILQEAIVLRTLGKVQASLGEVSKAKDSLSKSISILGEIGDPYELACSYMALASVLLSNNEMDFAKENFSSARKIAESLGANGLLIGIGKVAIQN